MQKVIVVCGPTATGKTEVALKLAKKLSGELVACDSRQVYKGLDIGTGKDQADAWMYDVADPKDQYSVYDYIRDASLILEDILSRGKLPIIVGGTGLYLKGLLEGIDNLSLPVDQNLRGELEDLSVEKLQEKLKSLSPTHFHKMNPSDQKNPRRLIRLIEIYTNPYVNIDQHSQTKVTNYDVLKIGLTAPRPVLNLRIDQRLDNRIEQGLIEEGQRLLNEGVSLVRMHQLGLEYKILADLLEGKLTKDQFTQQLKTKIHQYAKRQMIWFKKDPTINWFDITDKSYWINIEKVVSQWYDKPI